jgi:exosome complex RNA-binding protein Rrp4
MTIEEKFVTPGARISDKNTYELGRGVYLRSDKIYSSVAGLVKLETVMIFLFILID